MEAGKEGLTLTATNLEIGLRMEIGGKVTEEGAITIPAKKLTEIIKELPESIITITTKKNNTINIECENVFFKNGLMTRDIIHVKLCL